MGPSVERPVGRLFFRFFFLSQSRLPKIVAPMFGKYTRERDSQLLLRVLAELELLRGLAELRSSGDSCLFSEAVEVGGIFTFLSENERARLCFSKMCTVVCRGREVFEKKLN